MKKSILNVLSVSFVVFVVWQLVACSTMAPSVTQSSASTQTPASQHIAVLLPLSGALTQQGHAVQEGLFSAYYEGRPVTGAPTLVFYDTNAFSNVATLYQKAVKEGANVIIGPLSVQHVQQILPVADSSVMTLALNYANTGWGSPPAQFYQMGLSPLDEVEQVAQKAKQAGYSRALMIAEETPWAKRLVNALIEQWKAQGGSMVDVLWVTPSMNLSNAIAAFLHIDITKERQRSKDKDQAARDEERRHDVDVIFLMSSPEMGRQVRPLLKYHYAGDIPVYSTSAIYSGAVTPDKDVDLDGIIFCDIPWMMDPRSEQMTSNPSYKRFYAVGRDAYHLITVLPSLSRAPQNPWLGDTGALTLNSKQQIHRQLIWMTFHEGRLQKLAGS